MSVFAFLEAVTGDPTWIYILMGICGALMVALLVRRKYQKSQGPVQLQVDPATVVQLQSVVADGGLQPTAAAPKLSQEDLENLAKEGKLDGELAKQIEELESDVSNKATTIADLEAKLAQETAKLEEAMAASEAAIAAGGDGGGEGGASSAQIEEMEKQVEELSARLKEYEIIEEDIADLSHYKEKAETLEQEVADLKSKLENGGGGENVDMADLVAEATDPTQCFDQHVSFAGRITAKGKTVFAF